MRKYSSLIKKIKKITILKIVKRIPNKRIRNYILPRLYYYMKFRPNHLMLDISSKCNSACPFCPRTILIDEIKGGKNMQPEIFYKAVDGAHKLGIRSCQLYTTGEPLLHPNIDEFIKHLKSKGFHTMISTNAQFLDKHFEALSLLDEVKISIEGWDKESYEYYRKNCDFEKVQSNLVEFKKYLSTKEEKPLVTIGLMVMRETNMDQFFKVWRDKVDRVVIYPTSYVFDWDKNDKIDYLSFDSEKRLKDNMYDYEYDNNGSKYCSYPTEIVMITAEGNGGVCCSDFTDSITYGNLKDKSLSEIIYSPKRRSVQRQFVEQKLNVCDGCSIFSNLDEKSDEDYKQKVEQYIGQ